MSDRPYNRPCSDVCVGGLLRRDRPPTPTRVLFAQYGRPTNRPCSPMLISNSPPNLTEPDYERKQTRPHQSRRRIAHQTCENNTAQSSVFICPPPRAKRQRGRNPFVRGAHAVTR